MFWFSVPFCHTGTASAVKAVRVTTQVTGIFLHRTRGMLDERTPIESQLAVHEEVCTTGTK